MEHDFGDKTLYDLILPGTHDTGSYIVDLGDSCGRGLTPRGAVSAITSLPLRLFLRRSLIDYSRTQHLTVYEQLKAGSRFQDLRVSKLKGRDTRFWIIHGMVASVPLEVALEDMDRFHDECKAKTPIVTVIRCINLSREDVEELGVFLRKRLRHGIYDGTSEDLRRVPYMSLPENVIAGVPGLSGIGMGHHRWGSDVWIDTYDMALKVAGNTTQVAQAAGREGRNDLFVLGWTVTPHLRDILRHAFTFGLTKNPILEHRAREMNEMFEHFATMNALELQSNVNVVFFDFLDKKDADRVLALNMRRA